MHHKATPEVVARTRYPGFVYRAAPLNVYWEMTLACGLACRHCRADAVHERDPRELSTDEAKALLADIRMLGSMVVLTGGDPMKRPDLFELIAHGRSLGVPMAVTPSMTPALERDHVLHMKELGVAALGMSLDGPNPLVHDGFRGVSGTFQRSREFLAWAREAHLPVQVNTTVTRETIPHLAALYRFLREEAAPPVKRWVLFFLVPTGRGKSLLAPSAEEVEQVFEWIYDTAQSAPFHVSTIEAPHYRRYWLQRKLAEGATHEALGHHGRHMGLGVRDGNGVVFISHQGEVYPAGFLPAPLLGNVRTTPLSRIYRSSPDLALLRDMDRLEGKCGRCEFRWACGGSRARGYAATGSLMGSDPLCAYEPAGDDATTDVPRHDV